MNEKAQKKGNHGLAKESRAVRSRRAQTTMRALRHMIAILATGTLAACQRAPTPFDCAFSGESSGTGYVMIDRLSADRTRGVVFYADLLPAKGNSIDAIYFERLREEGVLILNFQVGSHDPVSTIQVFEFASAVSGHAWFHGNYEAAMERQWDAESGNITLVLRRAASERISYMASVTLSNVVFTTNGTRRRKRIDRLTIQDVQVGGARM
jgi:hypothetical protein